MASDTQDIIELCNCLGEQFIRQQRRLVTVESCTGGGVAYFLTMIAGSSEWFERGLVTYSNQAKTELAGVADRLIKEKGAVSEDVAKAMALGGLSYGTVTDAVAVTGVAGPGGGTAEKPVGTVCFAWAYQAGEEKPLVRAERVLLQGNRHEIRIQSITRALLGLQQDF